jgi:hypothetical protein
VKKYLKKRRRGVVVKKTIYIFATHFRKNVSNNLVIKRRSKNAYNSAIS